MNPLSYREQAYIFLQQADEELARGDLRQASEKAWGAAAQAVKAAGEARGWEHDTHGRLFVIARRLSEEQQDSRVMRQFRRAGRLHQNFYEGKLDADQIASALADVARLVETIGDVLSQ